MPALAADLVPCEKFFRANRERSNEDSPSFATELHSYLDSIKSLFYAWPCLLNHITSHFDIPGCFFSHWLLRIFKSGEYEAFISYLKFY